VRVPKSYVAPHMVKNGDWGRFYTRGSNGKRILDVGEIRSAFALSEALPERIRQFRAERLARIITDETPVALNPGPRVVLHLLPIAALGVSAHYDLRRFEYRRDDLPPLSGGGTWFRYNLDGLLIYIPRLADSDSHGYVQLYRNGTIESVDAHMLSAWSKERVIPQSPLETIMISHLKNYLKVQQDLGLVPPIVLLLELIGVRGFSVGHGAFQDTKDPIDRDTLLLPDVLVENFSDEPTEILRPVFDGIWQAAGWPRCMNYNEKGIWEDCSRKLLT